MKVTGCTIWPGASAEDIRAALLTVGEQCRPCGSDFAIQQLALLRVRTKARADVDPTLTAAAYGDWLAEYPKDVAARACEEWGRAYSYWPAWADLQRICDRMVSARLELRRALQTALKPPAPVVYLGQRRRETRKERLQGLVNSFLRNSMPHKAAPHERELAALEDREPEAWAKNQSAEPPTLDKPERPPFKPLTTPTALRCAELARQRHLGVTAADEDTMDPAQRRGTP